MGFNSAFNPYPANVEIKHAFNVRSMWQMTSTLHSTNSVFLTRTNNIIIIGRELLVLKITRKNTDIYCMNKIFVILEGGSRHRNYSVLKIKKINYRRLPHNVFVLLRQIHLILWPKSTSQSALNINSKINLFSVAIIVGDCLSSYIF
jgi:hypothetical protein